MAIAMPMTVVEYPSGEGRPMTETWLHVRAIMLLHQALEDFFQNRSDVFIGSDLYWYWEQGNPSSCIAPDVMVVPGVTPRDPQQRRSFLSWEEGDAIPAAIFEITSQNTWKADLDEKYDRYEKLGVREYFVFDPEGTALLPKLQGFRLAGTSYRRMHQNEIESELGFGLQVEDTMLRLLDTRTGRPIYTRAEAVAIERDRADNALLRAAAEQQRAEALQAEVDRLRAQLQRHGLDAGSGT